MGAEISCEARDGFEPGTKVKINCDKKTLKSVHLAANRWDSELKELIGKQLKLKGFDRDGDAMVECNNRRAVLKPLVLSTIPDDEVIPEKGDNARLLSSEDHPEVSDMVGVVFEIVTDDNVITCKVAFSDTAGSEAKVAEIQREHLKWVKCDVIGAGDDVIVVNCEEAVKTLQEGHGEYHEAMKHCLGKKGIVKKFNDRADAVVLFDSVSELGATGAALILNTSLLRNVSPPDIHFAVGDKIKVTSNAKKFKRIQKHRVQNWKDAFKRLAGRSATVVDDSLTSGKIGVKFVGIDEVVTTSKKVIDRNEEEEFFEGERVVCLLSSDQLENLLKDETYKAYQNEEGTIVSLRNDSPQARVAEVALDNGTKFTFPTSLILSCVLPDPDSDDSDSTPSAIPEYTFLGSCRGLSVGDRVSTDMEKAEFNRVQQIKGGERNEHLFEAVKEGRAVVKGLTTKGKVILMSEPNEPGQLAHYIGKVSRSGLEKDERKAENEWLFVGDTVKIAASTNETEVADRTGKIVSKSTGDEFFVCLGENEDPKSCCRNEVSRIQHDVELTVGDEVSLSPDARVVAALLNRDGLAVPRDLSTLSGLFGFVEDITEKGFLSVKFEDYEENNFENAAEPILLSHDAVFKTKPTQFYKVGDKVKLIDHVSRIKSNQKNHGEWSPRIQEGFGKVGSVVQVIDSYGTGRKGDVRVKFADSGKVIDLILNPRSLVEFVDEFKRGDKVVCALTYDKMKSQLPDNYHMEGLHHLRIKHMSMGVVTRVHGSGVEAVISVVYGMNIEIKFIAKNILKIPSGPESSKPDDDSDSGDDEHDYIFLTSHRELSVGDQVCTKLSKDKFMEFQKKKKLDEEDALFEALETSGEVAGFSTKNFVLVATSGKDDTDADTYWKVSRKVLEHSQNDAFQIGDVVMVGEEPANDRANGDGAQHADASKKAVILSQVSPDNHKLLVAIVGDDENHEWTEVSVSVEQLKRYSGAHQLTVGDEVIIYARMDLVEKLQLRAGLKFEPEIENLFGKVGYVNDITTRGQLSIVFEGRSDPITVNTKLVRKATPTIYFGVGDKVKLIPDESRLRSNQKNHGEWVDPIKESIGLVGSVFYVINNPSTGRVKDVKVKFASSGRVIPVILNTRSLVGVSEVFARGDKIVCALTFDDLSSVLPADHQMNGLMHLRNKHMQAGKVVKVRGIENDALVTVRYPPEGIEITYIAKFVLKVPESEASGHLGSGFSKLFSGLPPDFTSLMDRFSEEFARDLAASVENRRQTSRSSSSSSSSDSKSEDEKRDESSVTTEGVPGDQAGTLTATASNDSEALTVAEEEPKQSSDASMAPPIANRAISMTPKTVSCVLCYNSDSLVALKCGHVLCENCANELLTNQNLTGYRKCPMDRKKFRKFIKLFL
ncbi:uncharacterized protein LOC134845572 isoform X3 [Symsagittifera roscoffensis]|uniref:uncharacterized protein LOC134845572 isoform X3 n=1 Tax=Symsagittifera roscoffensis TaxID=84072 RepID=UPI00307CA019